MGNGVATRLRTPSDEDHDGYVLVDARHVMLGGVDDEPAALVRPPLRGVLPPKFTGDARLAGEWRAVIGAPRRYALAEVREPASLWQRLARRVHLVWNGTRDSTPRA